MPRSEAVQRLERQEVDFEYDGMIAASVALAPVVAGQYPSCHPLRPASELVMLLFAPDLS